MNPDMHFGELEETQPETRPRPDGNRHFAVVPIGSPGEGDPPVFADMDVLLDVEQHALSDPNVELGGVLLGGQYVDPDGKPFIVITDSLRAQHYENTKGSFRFTHETWEQITREREHFPQEVRMVGWYHTHPDWGVFLSGMDTFICEHFFNRPLDVALVVDPCRQERAFFQWAGENPRLLQRAGGFYLIASRFRHEELIDYAAYLQGTFAMSSDPRVHGFRQAPSYPVVSIADGSHPWHLTAILGSLAIQFCVLALVAWRILTPPAVPPAAEDAQQTRAVRQNMAELSQALQRSRDVEINAKIAVLDEVVAKLGGNQPGLVSALADKARELDELRASIRGHRALEQELDTRIAGLQAELQKTQRERKEARGAVDKLQASLADLQKRDAAQCERIETLENKLAAFERPASNREDAAEDRRLWKWTWLALGAVASVLALGAAAGAVVRWRRSRQYSRQASEERDAGTNSH